MNGKRISFCSVLCFALAATTQASLLFEKTELDLKPDLGAQTATAVFKYENKGDAPVHIKGVKPSCGCTTAALAKNDVAPGEKGEITATFNIGDRSGLQVKTVTVETDDPKAPQTVLTFRCTIAQVLEVQPNFVSWQAGEATQPKTIIAKTAKGVTVNKVDVVSSTGDFTTKVEPGSNAGEFKIEIQPRSTTKPTNATLTIKPDSKPEKIYYAAARVMPPATAKP
jgi:hypothetical protein